MYREYHLTFELTSTAGPHAIFELDSAQGETVAHLALEIVEFLLSFLGDGS